ncbi:uncharacterized protein LOC116132414 [Pistacia vera]|uniref:uncharacterized protein LOC116132414 n=1 Tax=Pistacia vera TaxID=55513 RepID=UPI00126332C1|nr:uncharacterized protein LOC116132414 [Pistacia vera]
MRMIEMESVLQYFDRLMKVVNEIRILGEILPEERLVEKVMVRVLEKFKSKISPLKDSRDIKSMSIADLISALEAQEQRRKMRDENGLEIALRTKAQILGKEKDKGEEELLFTAMIVATKEQNDSWFIDSGCTQNMTGKKEMFTQLEDMKGVVRLGNGDKVLIKGKCTNVVSTLKAMKLIFDVLLAPNLSHNLMSTDQMMQKGFVFEFANNVCKVKDSNDVEFMNVPIRNRSFVMDWSAMDVDALRSKEEKISILPTVEVIEKNPQENIGMDDVEAR